MFIYFSRTCCDHNNCCCVYGNESFQNCTNAHVWVRENVQVRLVDEISSVLRNLGIGEMSHWGNNVVVEVVQYRYLGNVLYNHPSLPNEWEKGVEKDT